MVRSNSEGNVGFLSDSRCAAAAKSAEGGSIRSHNVPQFLWYLTRAIKSCYQTTITHGLTVYQWLRSAPRCQAHTCGVSACMQADERCGHARSSALRRGVRQRDGQQRRLPRQARRIPGGAWHIRQCSRAARLMLQGRASSTRSGQIEVSRSSFGSNDK